MLKMKQYVKLIAGIGRLFLLSILRTKENIKEKWVITVTCQKLHKFKEHVTLQ